MALTVIDAKRPSLTPLGMLLEYRDYSTVLRYLAMRDVRLRFRRAYLGIAWVVLQPLLPMIVLTAVFSQVLRPSALGVPYSLFALSGMVPWSYFSGAISNASTAFITNANLLNKVYFPRGILPLASVLASALDLMAGFALLCGFAMWNGYMPRLSWLLLPLIAVQTVFIAFFVSLALATLNVLYRDVKHALQFIVQLWMYASPVVYSASLVPPHFRWLFAINPITCVLSGVRSALFSAPFEPELYWGSLVSGIVISFAAVLIFRRYENLLAERA